MKVILVVFIVFVVVVLLGWLYIISGSYDIAATSPHSGLTAAIMDETMESAVKHQAKGITVPNLDDPALLKVGFEHYDAMCATCHGAPGVSRSEIGRGLYPKPPSLVTVLDDWTPAELYWIVKNGIKDTGMPAFGPTHTEDELWAMVAFAESLPKLEPADYLAKRKSLEESDSLGHDGMMMHDSDMEHHHHGDSDEDDD